MLFFATVLAAPVLRRENRVTVYIWNSSVKATPKAYGHAALELREKNQEMIYFSLWPKRPVSSISEKVPAVLAQDYLADFYNEERKPADHVIVFYNVNFDLLRQRLKRIKQRVDREEIFWTPNGGVDEDAQNCATSVCKLLDGCLRSAKQESLTVMHSAFNALEWRGEITPSTLCSVLKKVKAKELAEFPETYEFDHPTPGRRRGLPPKPPKIDGLG